MHAKTCLLPALFLSTLLAASLPAQAQADRYPAMAPLAEYLMPEADEIALARSAAPQVISEAADVMVLGRQGYSVAAKGTNGFVCLVERGWAGDSSFADFWNPKQRAPICFNPAAAQTYAPIYLMRTRLVLAGKSKQESLRATGAAQDSHELPALAPGAMCYMMSRQQYLDDEGKNWRPHMMFFVQGDAVASWGANLAGSPVMATSVPDERVTIFMILASHWSDGSPAPAMNH